MLAQPSGGGSNSEAMPRLMLLLRQARALAVHVTRTVEACETAVFVQTNGPAQSGKRMLGASFASSAEPPDDSKPPASPALSESEEDSEGAHHCHHQRSCLSIFAVDC